jgi:hypothetical protein
MTELNLQISSAAPSSNGTGKLQLKQVQQRIDAFSPFDIAVRMQELQQLLADMNCVKLPVKARQALLDRVNGEVEDALPAYQKEVRHLSFPLPAESCSLYSVLQQLLNEAATAYKLLILDLLPKYAGKKDKTVLCRAMLQCIEYLSQQALQAYATYQDPPAAVWQDLNCLYAYAEKHQMSTLMVEPQADLSIGAAYARTLLLALANPYHFMQGEAYQAYEKLKQWAPAVHFQHPDELPEQAVQDLLIDRHFCDLASDNPPCYGIRGVTDSAADPRLLKLDELLAIIGRRMKVLALNFQRSLQLRSEWDLLHRLRDAWEKRRLRSEPRKIEHGAVKAIVGLSGCHHFYSGYLPFEPEKREVLLHGDDFSSAQSLSLVPTGDTPWLDHEVQTKLQSGEIRPRAYRFDTELIETDIWKKANTTGPRRDTALEKKVGELTLGTIFEFKLTNNSLGGEALQTQTGSPVQLRVGDLVAAFPHTGVDDNEPALHAIRWMHSESDRKLSMGLRRIHGDVTPVAVRALSAEAQYKSYARAFLLKNDKGHTSLIVPAGLFDFGNVILLNDAERLAPLRLESFVENTRAFAQFTFKPLDADAQVTDVIIDTLKDMLREEIS